MNNMPKPKLGIVAVSRDCFPVDLSQRRRAGVVEACRKRGIPIVELQVTIENEKDALRALAEALEKGDRRFGDLSGKFRSRRADDPAGAGIPGSGDDRGRGRGERQRPDRRPRRRLLRHAQHRLQHRSSPTGAPYPRLSRRYRSRSGGNDRRVCSDCRRLAGAEKS